MKILFLLFITTTIYNISDCKASSFQYSDQAIRYHFRNKSYEEAYDLIRLFENEELSRPFDTKSRIYSTVFCGDYDLTMKYIISYFQFGFGIESLLEIRNDMITKGLIDKENFLLSDWNEIECLYGKYSRRNLTQIKEFNEIFGMDQSLRRMGRLHGDEIKMKYDSLNRNRFILWLENNTSQIESMAVGELCYKVVVMIRHLSDSELERIYKSGLIYGLVKKRIINLSDYAYAYDYKHGSYFFADNLCNFKNILDCPSANSIEEINKNRRILGLLPIQYCYIHKYRGINFPDELMPKISLNELILKLYTN